MSGRLRIPRSAAEAERRSASREPARKGWIPRQHITLMTGDRVTGRVRLVAARTIRRAHRPDGSLRDPVRTRGRYIADVAIPCGLDWQTGRVEVRPIRQDLGLWEAVSPVRVHREQAAPYRTRGGTAVKVAIVGKDGSIKAGRPLDAVILKS